MTAVYLKDADDIWADFKHRTRNDDVFSCMDSESQLSFYQKKHKEFATSFPIVLRYMIQMKQYSSKAFERHLKKLQAKPYRSESEYCERQADYVMYLYTELTQDHDDKKKKSIWRSAYKMLMDETAEFKKAHEQAKKNAEACGKSSLAEKRNELKTVLKQQLATPTDIAPSV
jgi:hypothetical protein